MAINTTVTSCAYKAGDTSAEASCNNTINTARKEASAAKQTCGEVKVSAFSSEPGSATVLQQLICKDKPVQSEKPKRLGGSI